MGSEKVPLFMPRQALFSHRRPLDSQNDNYRARVSWGSALSIPQQPPQLRPDLASTIVSQQRNGVRTSTTGSRTSSIAPRMSPRPIINITTTSQGWSACSRAHRHSRAHSAHPAFFSKSSPRIFVVNLDPPLVSIKGEGKEFSRDEHKTDVFSTSTINISSNTPPYFLLRLGIGSLFHRL
jgi:hypothetical protein